MITTNLLSVNVDIFTIALKHFAQAISAGLDRRIILLLYRARWHESGELALPEDAHLVFQPPYSPEVQPCERLWPLSNEAMSNRRCETLDDQQEVQAARCVTLQNDPTCLRRVALFHW
ncbi:hypothetical protein KSC_043590 [Ktedonobacter sp. SOSP1-52]|uniref:hypothetical protein n=1 Tax=Ktedonobacter sp. SOSP1-52 TaxID=2778366 RepID=UPI001915A162|nr:hypothetical protein [Ktedonobacter sp. SOSP1-52]GHO65467.1 hypothetical protein KSC_043590 [Ktedonobacter sp. SOSP1-52]